MEMDLKKYYNRCYSYESERDLSNPLTRYLLKNRIKIASLATGKVLDIGCGDGYIATHIKGDITGIDISKKLVEIARKRRIKAGVGNAEKLRFPNNSFDTIIILDTLEHLKNPLKCLKEVKRVLKKRGTLLLTVPSLFGMIPLALEIKAKLGGQAAPIHVLYTKKRIRNLVMSTGLKISEAKYIASFNMIFIKATK